MAFRYLASHQTFVQERPHVVIEAVKRDVANPGEASFTQMPAAELLQNFTVDKEGRPPFQSHSDGSDGS